MMSSKDSLRVKNWARVRIRAGLMLCTWILGWPAVHAGERDRDFTFRVFFNEEKKTATVALTGAKILDQDLKMIRMPEETEKISICDASTSLITREGFAAAVAGLPVKELIISCYSGENTDFLQVLGGMKGLQKVHLNLSQLSIAWMVALGKVQSVHEGGLELSVSVLDGSAISPETLFKLDGPAAWAAIRLSARLNEEPLIQLAQKNAGKLKRVSVMTSDAMKAMKFPSGGF